MRRTASALLAPLLLVVGCGEDGDVDSSDGVPSCSDVWVEGQRLPRDYAGCMDGLQMVTPALIPCADGDLSWTTYDGRLAAVLGGEIFSVVEPGDDTDEEPLLMLSC